MISVIIANYNRKDLLKKCLDSVMGQGFKDIEIIVIDNASTDDSVEMTATYYPEARLIRNTKNLLFCKAYNQGIEASRGNFVLCLNNDVVLDKDYLKEALFTIGLDNKIGMVSGKILRMARLRSSTCNSWYELRRAHQAKLCTISAQQSLMDKKTIDSTGLFLGRNRKPVERGYGKKDAGQYDEPGHVFGVGGACAFFRKSMLNELKDEHGYFDERFGMYYEDLDLCWRAQKKAWKAYYNPKAIAYHVRGGTTVDKKCRPGLNLVYISWDLKKRYIRNRYRCMKKNDTLRGALVNLPFILFYELKLWSYIVFKTVFKIFLDRHCKI
ncbi:MAG: glycosyltransferase family 2 protein [Candidatus Omnitrophica bacterium]|nr:glycosyltransferase family 2 protein [Candidatus Omnitrophota bacterium]